MSNMNSRTRQISYEYLKLRDGEYCRICGVSDENKLLIVDHIDNDNSNNTPKNLQLLCRRCNYNKNPRQVKAEPLDNVGVYTKPRLDISMEIRINREKEPLFREYVVTRVNTQGICDKNDLINGGAEKVGLSPKTTYKYLRKMCSSEGQFQIIRKDSTDYVIKRIN